MDNEPNGNPNPEPSTPQPSSSQPSVVKVKHAHKFIYAYIMLIIVAAAVGGVYAWQHNKVTAANKQVSALTAQVTNLNKEVATLQVAAKKTSSASTTTQAAISSSAVNSLLTNFYNQYIACITAGNLNQTCTNSLIAKYGTAELESYYKPSTGSYAADPIVCAQEAPTSVSVSGIVTSSNTASSTVVEDFKPPVNVSVKLVTDSTGNLLINSVTCSPPLVAGPTH